MPKLTFVTQSAQDDGNSEVSTERLINCYAEQAPRDGKTRLNIRTVPGQEAVAGLSTIGSAGTVRAAIEGGYLINRIYVARNGDLFQVNVLAPSSTNLGNIADDTDTDLVMHGLDVTIAANNTYYVYDNSASSILTPGSGAIGNVRSVAYLNGYTILTSDQDQRFEWTDLGDPTTRNALNFASADTKKDLIIRAMADESILWLFGETSIELWYTTGESGADAFARVPNGVIDRGLRDFNLICQYGTMIFFVGEDDRAFVTIGTEIKPVSTPPVVTAIQQGNPTRCFAYQHRGHTFAVIKFSDRPAWVYDLETQLWHERASGDKDNLGAWEQHVSATVNGEWYGIESNGEFFRMADTYDDRGVDLPRRMVSANYYQGGEQFSVSELEFLCGMGRQTGADVGLRVSKDGGNSWSSEMVKSLGNAGDYNNRVVYRALGTARQFAAEFTVDADADIPLYSDANLRIA